MNYNEFIIIPTKSYLNIIMPYEIITEDDEEYTLKCLQINNLSRELET